MNWCVISENIMDQITLRALESEAQDIGVIELNTEKVKIKTHQKTGPFIAQVQAPIGSKKVAGFIHFALSQGAVVSVMEFSKFSQRDTHRDIQNTLLEAHRKFFPPTSKDSAQ